MPTSTSGTFILPSLSLGDSELGPSVAFVDPHSGSSCLLDCKRETWDALQWSAIVKEHHLGLRPTPSSWACYTLTSLSVLTVSQLQRRSTHHSSDVQWKKQVLKAKMTCLNSFSGVDPDQKLKFLFKFTYPSTTSWKFLIIPAWKYRTHTNCPCVFNFQAYIL